MRNLEEFLMQKIDPANFKSGQVVLSMSGNIFPPLPPTGGRFALSKAQLTTTQSYKISDLITESLNILYFDPEKVFEPVRALLPENCDLNKLYEIYEKENYKGDRLTNTRKIKNFDESKFVSVELTPYFDHLGNFAGYTYDAKIEMDFTPVLEKYNDFIDRFNEATLETEEEMEFGH